MASKHTTHKRSRKFMAMAVVGTILGMSGAAFAAWTASSSVQQLFTTGSAPSLHITANCATPSQGGPDNCLGTATVAGNVVTWSGASNLGTSYSSGAEEVFIQNQGSNSVNVTGISIVSSTPTDALSTNTQVGVDMQNATVLYNGLLPGAAALVPTSNNIISAGGTIGIIVEYSAGAVQTWCGSASPGQAAPADGLSNAAPLPQSAAGTSDTFTATFTVA